MDFRLTLYHLLVEHLVLQCELNELVIGSKGELYKCWESVGNPTEVCGDIRNYKNQNERLNKWLNYDPFSDPECAKCIALPVCMGGCAHHALSLNLYESRCDSFRYTYREEVLRFVRSAKNNGNTDITRSVAELSHRP